MAKLTIKHGHQEIHIDFQAPAHLNALLASAGCSIDQPCGGRGLCGKCAVILTGNVSAANEAEKRIGTRLACQAILLGDAVVTVPIAMPMTQIEGGSTETLTPLCPMQGRFGAAVDIGTTTIVLQLYELQSGRCLGAASMQNPQTVIAADVIGRIDAAMKGKAGDLKQQVEEAIETLLISTCADTAITTNEVESLVVTGNTTMLYLLTGRNVMTLSRAPFKADCLWGEEHQFKERTAYLPDCMHAFVGADTTCAILASRMIEGSETALLCDIGTNGELALWHQGQLYVASTAAGPAFEGAGISCGCVSIPGAIDRVEIRQGQIQLHTIGNKTAVGICGSGLVDAIAAMLETDHIDETGRMEVPFSLGDGLTLTQGDIRAVQLAKAATNAGIRSLLSAAGCPLDAISTVYLAGGFGCRLNLQNAAKIGLIPAALTDRVRLFGNAALDGAALLLMDVTARSKVAWMRKNARHVRLDGNPEFAQQYVDAMLFENE